MIRLVRIFLIVLCVIINTACAGDLWAVKVTVVDEVGQPIEDADVLLTFLLSEGANQYAGVTTEKGVVTAMRRGALQLIVEATKEGYYDTFSKGTHGSQEVTVVLRVKKNPIPMYAKKTDLYVGEIVYGKWISYDLVMGDFLPPYGLGETVDFEFKSNYKKIDFWNDSYDLEVRFPNPNDGLVPFYVEHFYSNFKSNYFAPKLGYLSDWIFYRYRSKDKIDDTNMDRNRRYYFRVRTVLDGDESVLSSYYGKIYSEFWDLHYYLNPNENDRNVEFNPKQNLFLKLPPEERQFEP